MRRRKLYTFGVPAKESYLVLEQTELYAFTKAEIEELLKISVKFEIIVMIATENELVTYKRTVASFLEGSPET